MSKPAANSEKFHPLTALTDAARLFYNPVAVLRKIPREGSLRPETLRILYWGVLAGALDALTTLLGLRDGASGATDAVGTVILGPIFFLLIAAVITPCYHLLALASGALGTLAASYRTISTLIPLLVLDILFGGSLWLRLPLLAFKFFLGALAAEHVHAALRTRTRAVFATVLCALAVLNIWTASL
ncbi:MAG: hypothetical protein ABIJ96_16080 [Elusimicrobiota bacterium]